MCERVQATTLGTSMWSVFRRGKSSRDPVDFFCAQVRRVPVTHTTALSHSTQLERNAVVEILEITGEEAQLDEAKQVRRKRHSIQISP